MRKKREQRAQWHKKRPHRQNSRGDNSTGSIVTRWILFNLYVLLEEALRPPLMGFDKSWLLFVVVVV